MVTGFIDIIVLTVLYVVPRQIAKYVLLLIPMGIVRTSARNLFESLHDVHDRKGHGPWCKTMAWLDVLKDAGHPYAEHRIRNQQREGLQASPRKLFYLAMDQVDVLVYLLELAHEELPEGNVKSTIEGQLRSHGVVRSEIPKTPKQCKEDPEEGIVHE